MVTVSFKADKILKTKLDAVAKNKGINLSAYIKLILTKELNDELSRVTSNGLTVAEEMEILASDLEDDTVGPFDNVNGLIKSLNESG